MIFLKELIRIITSLPVQIGNITLIKYYLIYQVSQYMLH